MGHRVPVPTFRMSLLTGTSVIADRDNELTGEPVVARKRSEEEEKHKTWKRTTKVQRANS